MKKEIFNLVQEFLAFGIKAPNPEPIRIRQNIDEMVMVISFLYPRKFKHFVE